MISEKDRATVEMQIKREPRGMKIIVSRCHLGCPQVVETEAILADGSPFPTLYWLTCPVKVKAVSRLEDTGWASRPLDSVFENSTFRARFLRAQHDYIERRREGAADHAHPVFNTGIGGVRDLGATKCLHAHYAHYLVSGLNPLGELVAERLTGVACEVRCDGR